jgi:cold shock CspA family protein
MIGRISVLGTPAQFGVIKAENGLCVRFEHSAVMAYDVNGLAIDQLVSFDIENGPNPKAVNVCVRRGREHGRDEARQEALRLRYMGFGQNGGAREYRFDQVSVGGDAIHLVVNIPMSLFTKYHMSIQDGPALCLRVLHSDREFQPVQSLTDADVLAYVESKVLASAGSGRNRQTRARAPVPSTDEEV